MKAQKLLQFLSFLALSFSLNCFSQTWTNFSSEITQTKIVGVDSNFVYLQVDSGISKYNKTTHQFSLIPFSGISNPTCGKIYYNKVKVISSNNIWVSSYDMGMLHYLNGIWINYNPSNSNLPFNYVEEFDVNDSGEVYAICQNRGLAKFDGTNWQHYDTLNSNLPEQFLWHIACGNNGMVYLSTFNKGFITFDGNSNWGTIDSLNSPLYRNYAYSIPPITDNFGNLYLTSYNNTTNPNISILKYGNGIWTNMSILSTFYQIPNTFSSYYLKAGKNSNFLYSQDNGNINYWTTVFRMNNNGICDSIVINAPNFIDSWFDDYNGDVWIISDSIMYKFDYLNHALQAEFNFNSIPNTTTYNGFGAVLPSINSQNNHQWFGLANYTSGINLLRFNGSTWQTYNFDSLLTNNTNAIAGVFSVAENPQNQNLCFGSVNARILKYDGTNWNSEVILNSPHFGDYPSTSAIKYDRNNNLVAGFMELSSAGLTVEPPPGIAIKSGNNWNTEDLIAHGSNTNNVFAIEIDTTLGRNNYWIGTIGNGLMVRTNTGYIHYTSSNSPLPNDTIQCIAIDNFGRKWIGTFNGLAIYNDTTWTILAGATLPFPGKDIEFINFNPNDNYTPWVATDGGISYLQNNSWINFVPCNSGLMSGDVESIIFDNSCNVWLPTELGIDRLNDACNLTLTTDSIIGTVLNSDSTAFANHTVSFYKKNLGTLQPIGHATTDVNGHYTFTTIDSSIYVASNELINGFNNQFLVYQNNKIVRQDCFAVELNDTVATILNLQNFALPINNGIGSIHAKIININACEVNFPLRVYLIDTITKLPISTSIVSYEGVMNFYNLQNGFYQVWIDKFGIIDSLNPVITINNDTLNQSNVMFILRPHYLKRYYSPIDTSMTIDSTQSIGSNKIDADYLQLIPNPTTDYFTITFNNSKIEEMKISIFDVTGSEILKQNWLSTENINRKTVDIKTLANGVYYVQVKSKTKTLIKKLVVEHY